MKNFLFYAFSLFIFSSSSHATETNYDNYKIKKPMSYSVVVQDSQHNVLYSTNINNLNNANNINTEIQEKNSTVSYVDNCIKNNGIIESTKSSLNTGFKVNFVDTSDSDTSLVIHVAQIVSTKKINTGECDIEEMLLGTTSISQILPFIDFESKFYLKNNEGKQFPNVYYLKIHGIALKQ